MIRKLGSQDLLIAVFLVFILGLSVTVFVPNITAAATVLAQGDGLPTVLFWVLPLFVIVAVAMFYSYRAIRLCRIHE